jgi:hypothetical protein
MYMPPRVVWTLELHDQALDKLHAVTRVAVVIGTSKDIGANNIVVDQPSISWKTT